MRGGSKKLYAQKINKQPKRKIMLIQLVDDYAMQKKYFVPAQVAQVAAAYLPLTSDDCL